MPETCVLVINCKTKMQNILRYWKTIATSGGILYASLVRKPYFTLPSISYSDKWAHIVMYMLFGAVLLWELSNNKVKKNTRIVISLALPILYGGLIEILQEQFFYPRTGDWIDWVADIVGTIMGVAPTYWIWKMKKN